MEDIKEYPRKEHGWREWLSNQYHDSSSLQETWEGIEKMNGFVLSKAPDFIFRLSKGKQQVIHRMIIRKFCNVIENCSSSSLLHCLSSIFHA